MVTATEFKNRTGRYLDDAARAPVMITRFGRPVRILLDIEDYESLQSTKRDREEGVSQHANLQRDVILQKLRAHQSALEEYGIEHLALFGSVARGEANSDSDIDLLVRFRSGIKIGLAIVRIKSHLEEILGKDVDLLHAPVTNARLKANIMPDLVYAF